MAEDLKKMVLKTWEIEQGDAFTFLETHCRSASDLLHAILRGLSQNTIKYRQNRLVGVGGSIQFADGSFFYPDKVLDKLFEHKITSSINNKKEKKE